MRRMAGLLVCVCIGFGVILLCTGSSAEGDYKIEEMRLGTFHRNARSVAFSKDGCHLAYVIPIGKKWLVVVDGQPGPEYDDIIKNSPAFRAGGTVEYLAFKAGYLFRVKHVPVGAGNE